MEQQTKVRKTQARPSQPGDGTDLLAGIAQEALPGFSRPSEEKIVDWKERYPDSEIYMVPLGGEIYVFRTLTRSEYHAFLATIPPQATEGDVEEKIADLCLLWPESYLQSDKKRGKAGVPSAIMEMVFSYSGFQPAAPPVKL